MKQLNNQAFDNEMPDKLTNLVTILNAQYDNSKSFPKNLAFYTMKDYNEIISTAMELGLKFEYSNNEISIKSSNGINTIIYSSKEL